jgi:hypothetical protein
MLAKDPNGDVVDADVLAIFQDCYTSYWTTFLRDRITPIPGFVTFAVNEYIAEASTAVRDVQSLMRAVTLPQSTTGNPMNELERDEFEAVVADVENNPADNGVIALPKRWGMRQKVDNSKPIIAIYPATTGITLAAHAYALQNTLSTVPGTGDLQGDPDDGYAVARLAACEIMSINGEDPADIQTVFNLLDQKVKDKFRDINWRTQPRESANKEQ